MNSEIRFEKVPLEEFVKEMKGILGEETKCKKDVNDWLAEMYENIKLPVRKTSGSAGYDFFIPFDITLSIDGVVVIPTGIRAIIPEGTFLGMYPRSGLGFKFRTAMANTVGIIDSDYQNADNYGHIKMEMIYDGINPACILERGKDNITYVSEQPLVRLHKHLRLKAGDAFCQGIIQPYLTDDIVVTEKRTGGFGSTDKTN